MSNLNWRLFDTFNKDAEGTVLLHCAKLVQLFGLCSTAGIDVTKMYRVQGGSETLLMFKEDLGTPSTTITVRVTLNFT